MNATPRSFLVVDDHDDFATLAARYLAREWPEAKVEIYNPVRRGRPPAAFDWGAWDVVLLDYQLGTDDGLRWLRTYGRTPGFPVTIMLTAEGSEDVAVKAFKLGAIDYIPKRQLNAAVLIAAVREAWSSREPPPAAPPGPVVVAGYRILEKIGEGATASVYRAERLSDGLALVIKTLRTEGSGVDTYVERFLMEYDIIDRLRHPNIVRIYDRGCTSDSLYIAMEYFPAGDLQQHLRMLGPVAPATALAWTRQIALGLAAVHRAGIVHRDLKPGNVMFRDDGNLALIDFGIAKELESDRALTRAGLVLGTPGYSSPENLTGKLLDPRSDLYSTGVMLYEMLTGRKPFLATRLAAVVYQQVNGDMPKLPPPWEPYQELIDRTTARDPDERYCSAEALIEAIDALATTAGAAPETHA